METLCLRWVQGCETPRCDWLHVLSMLPSSNKLQEPCGTETS